MGAMASPEAYVQPVCEYALVTDMNASDFANQVNVKLGDGWQLHGETFLSNTPFPGTFCQAFMRWPQPEIRDLAAEIDELKEAFDG